MKLNKRLFALSEMVNKPYDTVWDCCCDHGLLGYKILMRGLVKQVNFVDIVPNIIEQLNIKIMQYEHFLPSGVKWRAICENVAELQLLEDKQAQINNNTNPIQLVIISGVGGELMIEMLEGLLQRYSGENIDYLLCPVQNSYKLRSALLSFNFKLITEQLIIDNNRGYELLLVNQHAKNNITLTGKQLWKQKQNHKEYLEKLILHYQRIVVADKYSRHLEKSALDDYRNLYLKMYQI